MDKNLQDLEDRIDGLEKWMREHAHSGNDQSKKTLVTSFVTMTILSTGGATSTNYTHFFTATKPCYVKAITQVHAVKGTDAGAVTLQIERLTGTTAPGSGTNLLLTAFDLKGNINATQYAGLRTGNGLISQSGLGVGDRLALKTTGVLTAVASVQVTVEIAYYN